MKARRKVYEYVVSVDRREVNALRASDNTIKIIDSLFSQTVSANPISAIATLLNSGGKPKKEVKK